jgi:hypothetical protein
MGVSPEEYKGIYSLGEKVDFTEDGQSHIYVRNGWSGQEQNFRWTESRRASLRLKLESPPANDLLLRIKAFPYLARGEIKRQVVDVTVNGEKVAQWNMQGEKWYEAKIPAGLVGEDDRIQVAFNISNPASPAEFGHSSDSRKLGMGVRELVIKKAAN